MPGDRYGRSLPPFTVNLLVRDVPRAVGFYEKITPAVLQRDDPWAAEVTGRQALLWHLDRFAAVDHGHGLGALVEALSALNVALRRRWAAERAGMFVWPAFR